MPLFKKKPKVKPWKPATKFTVVKLKRSGPEEGQSTDAYLYGKALGDKRRKFKPVQ
jgi:hypothetical protein